VASSDSMGWGLSLASRHLDLLDGSGERRSEGKGERGKEGINCHSDV
jgi:hypothetical protein